MAREMAALFYEELIALRLPTTPALRALKLSDGFVCDPTSNHCTAAADAPEQRYPTAWLPTESLARVACRDHGNVFLNRVQRSMADGRSPHHTLEYGG